MVQQHGRSQPATPAAGNGQSGSSNSDGAAAAAAAAAVVASGLADMVCLSQDELADLLGCEDETCQLLLAAAPHNDGCAAAAAGSAAADGTAAGAGAGAVQRLMRSQEVRYMQQQSLLQRQLEGALAQLGSSSSSSYQDDLRASSSSSGAGLAAVVSQDVYGSDAWAGQYGGVICSRNLGGEMSDGVKGVALQPVLAALQLEASAVQGGLQAAVVAACVH